MKIEGVVTALVTPFDQNGRVDEKALRNLCRFQLKEGVNGVFLLGTTGEGLLQSKEERKFVTKVAIEELKGKIPVLIHVGGTDIDEVFELERYAVDSGVDAITSITPYFFKLSEREIIEFYVELSHNVPFDYPIYIYNFPDASGNDVTPEAIETILNKTKNVVGLKFSSADMVRMQEYIKLKKYGFNVLSGCDQLFYPLLSIGCDGLVSGNANILPNLYLSIFNNFKKGDQESAKQLNYYGSEVAKLFKYGNIPNIKAGMKLIGLDGGYVKKPFKNLTSNELEILQREFTKIYNELKEVV